MLLYERLKPYLDNFPLLIKLKIICGRNTEDSSNTNLEYSVQLVSFLNFLYYFTTKTITVNTVEVPAISYKKPVISDTFPNLSFFFSLK